MGEDGQAFIPLRYSVSGCGQPQEVMNSVREILKELTAVATCHPHSLELGGKLFLTEDLGVACPY